MTTINSLTELSSAPADPTIVWLAVDDLNGTDESKKVRIDKVPTVFALTIEGTSVLSTGEGGGTKYLREDGDNSSSWQTITISTDIGGLGTNVATFLGTPSSANLIAAVNDETGTGALVFSNSPTLVTPALGTPSGGVLTNCTGLPVAGIATFTSSALAGRCSDETGTGVLVFGTTPTIATANLTGVSKHGSYQNQATETTLTPAGTTQTMTCNTCNHQTLALTSATGTVTFTLTVPTNVCSGTIIIKQHATVTKDLTWALSSGTIKWMGGEPDWGADAISSIRLVAWRWDGTNMYLAPTEVAS